MAIGEEKSKKSDKRQCFEFSAARINVITNCVSIIALVISVAAIVLSSRQSSPDGYSAKIASLKQELQTLKNSFGDAGYKLHGRIDDLHNSSHEWNQDAIERNLELNKALLALRTEQQEQIEQNTREIYGNLSRQISQLELRLQDLTDKHDLEINELDVKFLEMNRNLSVKVSQLERMLEDLTDSHSRDISTLGGKLGELSDNVTRNMLNSNAKHNEVRRNLSSIRNDAARFEQLYKTALSAVETADAFDDELKEDIRLLRGSLSDIRSRVINLENNGRRPVVSTAVVMMLIFRWIYLQE